MADRKISELTNITGADLADGDEFVLVDASADETKALTFAELKAGLDTATGFVRITGDTMTGDLVVSGSIEKNALDDGARYYSAYKLPNVSITHNEARVILLCQTGVGRFISGAIYGARQTASSATRVAVYEFQVAVNSTGTLQHANLIHKGVTPGNSDRLFTCTYDGNSYLAIEIAGTGSAAYPTGYLFTGFASNIDDLRAVDDDSVSSKSFYSGETGNIQIRNQAFIMHNGASVFNEGSTSNDFRVESNSDTHMLFVDGTNDRVGIGAASPQKTLEIEGDLQLDATDASIWLKGGVAGTSSYVNWTFNSDSTVYIKTGIDYDTRASIGYHIDSGYPITLDASMTGTYGIDIQNGGTLLHRITSGTTAFNENGADHNFKIEGDNEANTFFVDASADSVGIGTSNPSALSGNTVGGTSLFTVAGSVGNTHFADTGNQISFTRGSANYITANNSGADIIVDVADSFAVRKYDVSAQSTSSRIFVTGSAVTINNDGADVDFRVESSSEANMFVVNAGNNCVNINHDSATSNGIIDIRANPNSSTYIPTGNGRLHVETTSGGGVLTIIDSGATDATTAAEWIDFSYSTSFGGTRNRMGYMGYGSGSTVDMYINNETADGGVRVYSRLADNSGSILNYYAADDYNGFNENGDDVNFRVSSSNETNAFFVDGGNDRVGISTAAPNALLQVGGVGDSIKVGRINSTIRGGGAANHNWYKICQVEFLSSSFAHTAFHVNIVGSGGTSGEDVSMEFMLFKKQQSSTDRWTLKPMRKFGMDLAYKWDASGGQYSTGLLELWIAAEGVNYQMFDIRVQDLQANPDNSATYGEWSFTDTGSETQPTGSTLVLFPITGHQTRYTQGGLQNAQFVINDDSDDIDFRVESDTNAFLLYCDAGNDVVSFGASNGSNYGARLMSSIGGGSSQAPIACVNTTTSGTRRQIDFFDGSSTTRKGSIETDGTGTSFNTTSDRRLKTDIQPISDSVEKLMAMQPVFHKWKEEPEKNAVHGFIAQDMQNVIPEAVSGEPDGDDYMSMDYGRITPVIVAALQEAHKKIKELEERLSEMETAK